MANLSLSKPLDLLALDLTFPVGGTSTAFGFELLSGTGWRVDVTLAANDIATGLDLFLDDGGGFAKMVEITEINRPVVAPIGGPVQFLLALVLDNDDTLLGTQGGQGDGLSGYKGSDTIFGLGGGDTLLGAAGGDTIHGGRGKDVIRGGNGQDDLRGNLGADTIFGGNGHDRIVGGKGKDDLRGGAGQDTFFFRLGDGRDTIADFTFGEDLIDIGRGARALSDLDFDQVGNDVIVSFKDVTITVQDVTTAQMDDASNFIF